MNTNQVRGFLALAKYKNFSKAAESIYMTQPAFSRMIQSLEEELGYKLFNRSHTDPGITPMGEKLLPEFKAIADHNNNIKILLSQGNDETLDSLVVASFNFGWTSNGRKTCAHFLQDNPTAKIVVKEQTGASVFEALKTGEVDLIETIYVPKGVEQYLSSVPSTTFHYHLEVHESHPLANRESVRLEELKNERFVMLSKESFPIMYEKLVSMCVNAGFVPNVAFETDSRAMLSNMILTGNNIAVYPDFLKLSDGVVKVRIEGAEDAVCKWWYWKDNKKPILEKFINFVKSSPK